MRDSRRRAAAAGQGCRCAKCVERTRSRRVRQVAGGCDGCASCAGASLCGSECCGSISCGHDCGCGEFTGCGGCGESVYGPVAVDDGLGLPQHQPIEYEWNGSASTTSGCPCGGQTAYGGPIPDPMHSMPIDATDEGVIPGRTIRQVVPMPDLPPEPAPAAEPRDVNLPPVTSAVVPVNHWVSLPVERMSASRQAHQKDSGAQRISSEMPGVVVIERTVSR